MGGHFDGVLWAMAVLVLSFSRLLYGVCGAHVAAWWSYWRDINEQVI